MDKNNCDEIIYQCGVYMVREREKERLELESERRLEIEKDCERNRKAQERFNKLYRKCIGEKCNQGIKRDEPEWKVRCTKCYYHLKNPNN
jgi:hypothetical protein